MKIAVLGKKLGGKSTFIHLCSKLEDFVFINVPSLHNLAFDNRFDYIYECHSIDDYNLAKSCGFTTIYISLPNKVMDEIYSDNNISSDNAKFLNSFIGDIYNNFDYHFQLPIGKDNLETCLGKIKSLFQEILVYSNDNCIFKKYFKGMENNVEKFVTRKFYISSHAIKQFSKRIDMLFSMAKDNNALSNKTLNKLKLYEYFLTKGNLTALKKIFMGTYKFDPNDSKALNKRRKKYNCNSEYFTDNTLLFVVADNTVVTCEIAEEAFRFINNKTSLTIPKRKLFLNYQLGLL